MNSHIKEILEKSKILRFFVDLNKNLLSYFYKSVAYAAFARGNIFFRNVIIKNLDKSVIINVVKKTLKSVTVKDIGWFIILLVFFNTLVMMTLGRKIDVFSICARVFFFILGVILIYVRNMRIR